MYEIEPTPKRDKKKNRNYKNKRNKSVLLNNMNVFRRPLKNNHISMTSEIFYNLIT